MLCGMKCENYYEASFKQSEIITRAIYDQMETCLEQPVIIHRKIFQSIYLPKYKKKYAGKSIYGVTELSMQDEVSYHITLQDEKNWYVVKSDSWGTLELTKKFKKA